MSHRFGYWNENMGTKQIQGANPSFSNVYIFDLLSLCPGIQYPKGETMLIGNENAHNYLISTLF